MGCFSYICQGCGEPVLSNSYTGEDVILFHLQKGEVIQTMQGQYNSYGACFKEDGNSSFHWGPSAEEDHDYWCGIVDEHFDPEDQTSGIAAIHCECYRNMTPNERSDNDPNQGWGFTDEYGEDYDDGNYKRESGYAEAFTEYMGEPAQEDHEPESDKIVRWVALGVESVTIVKREFDSPAELDAYFRGLQDAEGVGDYAVCLTQLEAINHCKDNDVPDDEVYLDDD